MNAVRHFLDEFFEFSDRVVEFVFVHLADRDVFSEGGTVGMLGSHFAYDLVGFLPLLVFHELFHFFQLHNFFGCQLWNFLESISRRRTTL